MLNYLGMDEFTSSYLESALWSSTDDPPHNYVRVNG